MGKKRIFLWIIINVLVLTGVFIYSYQEHQAFNYLKIRSENMYQQAFHSLVTHFDTINTNLVKALATADVTQQVEIMTSVRKQVYAAQEELGKLPLVLVSLVNTEKVLSQINDFSYVVAKESTNGRMLTDEQWKTLAELKRCSNCMVEELNDIQGKILQNNLRWVDIELALNKNEVADNTVIDGLELYDEKLQDYYEAKTGLEMNVIKPEIFFVGGNTISKREAETLSLGYLNKAGIINPAVLQTDKSEGEIPAWTTIFQHGDRYYTTSVTEKGGQLFWIMAEPIEGKHQIAVERVETVAQQYLDAIGLKSMVLVGQTLYEHEVFLIYAYLKDDVIYYPDTIHMRVSLVDGRVSGFDANDYVKYHHLREQQQPLIAVTELDRYLRSGTEVESVRLAVIFNDFAQEVLTYEVAAQLGGESYLIYFNAQNGNEENIVNLQAKNR